MIWAYQEVKKVGLKNVRLCNTGIFAKSEKEIEILLEKVGLGNF